MKSAVGNRKTIGSCPIFFRQSDMATYYVQKALDILRKEGPVELAKRTLNFTSHKINKQFSRRIRVKGYTYKNDKMNKLIYECPPSPYETIRVRAKNIRYISSSKSGTPVLKPHYGGFAQVSGGEWPCDENFIHIDKYYIKTSFRERFLNDYAWEDTDYYTHLTQAKEYSNDEALRRLNSLDELYRSIADNGYLPNHSGENHKGNYEYREELDPFIVIDHVGELYLWDGRHRLSIAQILDLEIPVHVVCRHKQWQELRDEIHNNGLPEDREDLRDHPDLEDVLD